MASKIIQFKFIMKLHSMTSNGPKLKPFISLSIYSAKESLS